MSSPFEVSGSTKEMSADDLMRELCGDEDPAIESETHIAIDAGGTDSTAGRGDKEDDTAAPSASQPFILSTGDDPLGFDTYLSTKTGEFFVWDLETFPDESRFPRPLITDKPRTEVDLVELRSKNADLITSKLKSGVLQEDQLADLLQLENEAPKPRSTVAKAIVSAINDLDDEFASWKKFSLDPWQGRIVALSWSFLSDDQVYTLLAKNADEERHLLYVFWRLQEIGERVGFNIRAFDDKFIVARSIILGVPSTGQLDTGRYSKQGADIMLMLFGNLSEAIDCKTLAGYMNITVPEDGVSGKDVFGMIESGDWDLLRRYSASDVHVEKEMFRIVKRYLR